MAPAGTARNSRDTAAGEARKGPCTLPHEPRSVAWQDGVAPGHRGVWGTMDTLTISVTCVNTDRTARFKRSSSLYSLYPDGAALKVHRVGHRVA